ncbi:MAG: hypothetical protein IT204_17910 [Fimbriimonadaceae bacterium]|nr:hypothetical protein [Fimbriimonadaceae bacterium]
MNWTRWLLLLLLAGGAAPLRAQDDQAMPPLAPPADADPPASADEAAAGEAAPAGDAPPPAAFPERDAQLLQVTVGQPEGADFLRLTATLSWPKRSVETAFEGQATFAVTIPATTPAPKLARTIRVARDAVAEVSIGRDGVDTVLRVRLNTPARCRAYALPSRKQVVIEVEPPPAEPAGPDKPAGPAHEAKITAEFVDTDIRVIIGALVEQTGANIMLQPGVAGSYSLKLKQVTLTEALDALWEAWKLVWTRLPGNIYLVGAESDLGERRVDEDLPLPPNWQVADLWRYVNAQFPDLRLRRVLESIPEDGPLPVSGALKDVGRARRWIAALPPSGEGHVITPPSAQQDEATVFLKNLSLPEAQEALRAFYPQLTVVTDQDAGSLTLRGTRSDVYRGRRKLEELDREPLKDVEEAIWVPLVPPEKITDLATRAGVTLDIVYTEAEGTLCYLRGKEDKVRSLRELVKQLQDAATRRREREEKSAAGEAVSISRTWRPGTLSVAAAERLIAAGGSAVSATVSEGVFTISGRADQVKAVLAALTQADEPAQTAVYAVRYARPADLLRVLHGAVPELKLVDYQSQRTPGAGERVAPQLGPAAPEGAPKSADGPAEPPAERLGTTPRLILSGAPAAVERALTLLAQIDLAPPEVEVQALFAEVTPWVAQRLGLDRTGGPAGPQSLLRADLDLAQAALLIAGDEPSRVLSRPVLRCFDGGSLRFLVGQRQGVPSLLLVAGQPQASREIERIGVALELHCQVPGDGTVLCRLRPEYSQPAAGGAVATREAETSARVPDGQVLLLSGLLADPASARPAEQPARELLVLLQVRLVPPPAPVAPTAAAVR